MNTEEVRMSAVQGNLLIVEPLHWVCQIGQLHSAKVTVWCAVSSFRIIGPFFCEGEDSETVTVTAARYVRIMKCF